jgi:hypothetical protein
MRLSILALLIVSMESQVSRAAEGSDFQIANVRSQILQILFTGALDKDLDILTSQREQIVAIRIDRQEELRVEVTKLQEGQTKGAEIATTIQQISAHVDEEAAKRISEVLLPHQERRWRQIAMQMMFAGDKSVALLLPDVASGLDLTTEQKEEMQRLFKEGEIERQEADKEIRRKREQKMLDTLSADQRDRWRNLFGKPFVFGKD